MLLAVQHLKCSAYSSPVVPVMLCFFIESVCLVWRDTDTTLALGLYIHALDLITAGLLNGKLIHYPMTKNSQST